MAFKMVSVSAGDIYLYELKYEVVETSLHKASRLSSMEEVRCLVDRGDDINAKTSIGATPLLNAAKSNRREIFDLLLDAGANVDGCCKDKRTVLHYATQNGWIDAVPALVERLPDVNATDKNGETALHHAALFCHVEVAKCLIENGANIDAKGGYKGATPLLYAIMRSQKDIFDLLLNAGADITLCNDKGLSVLYCAASREGIEWKEVVQYLVKRVPDLNATDKEGNTALHAAAKFGRLEAAKCLVEAGADINASESGASPLQCATESRHRDVFNLLLHAGANVDDFPVLHFALNFGWMEEVRDLVKRVPDLEIRDSKGWTALHQATNLGMIEAVRCLVEEGADINSKTDTGMTPLLYAAETAKREIFYLLLHAGANVDGCSELKFTVLHYASLRGWLDAVRTLVKIVPDLNKNDEKTVLHNASIDINARTECEETALHLACVHGQLDVVEYLLQAHARCDILDSWGSSSLGYLIRRQRPNVKLIKLLIENAAVLLPKDYDAMLKIHLLKVEILQDTKFCCRVIVNKFNNYDLPQLYKLSVAGSLPSIEKMKMRSNSEVFQALQRSVRFEIETEGHCTQLKERPKALSVLSVKSVLEYYDKKKIQF